MYKNRAFTLIEALVVIGILTLMFALSIPAYRSYSRRNQLRQAAESVRSALVEAQNMALAPKESGRQYGAKRNSSTSYIVYKKPETEGLTTLRSYSLPDSVEWGTTDWDVYFTPPNAKASCMNNLSINLKLKNTPQTITVTLNCTTGQITIK